MSLLLFAWVRRRSCGSGSDTFLGLATPPKNQPKKKKACQKKQRLTERDKRSSPPSCKFKPAPEDKSDWAYYCHIRTYQCSHLSLFRSHRASCGCGVQLRSGAALDACVFTISVSSFLFFFSRSTVYRAATVKGLPSWLTWIPPQKPAGVCEGRSLRVVYTSALPMASIPPPPGKSCGSRSHRPSTSS